MFGCTYHIILVVSGNPLPCFQIGGRKGTLISIVPLLGLIASWRDACTTTGADFFLVQEGAGLSSALLANIAC